MGMVARSLGKEMGNNNSHFIFLVVIHVCESWTIKKAEHQRMLLLSGGGREDSRESLALQGDQTSQS